MIPLENFIGQERAIRAIEFGLGVNKPGFNIFVTGLTGTGKTTIIKAFLKKVAAQKLPQEENSAYPEDWCYVYNFSDPDRPLALNIGRGWGKVLKKDLDGFILRLKEEVKKTFESEDFARQRQVVIEDMQRQQQEINAALVEDARKRGFGLRFSPAGVVMIPLRKDGKPMQEEEFLSLSAQEKKVLEEGRSEIGQKMDQALREQQKLERQIADRLEALDRQAAELFDFTLGTHPISTKGTTEIGGAKRRSDF
jgi:hypothetical protein